MKLMTKKDAVIKHCKGRTIYGFIEKGGIFQSKDMMMGIARFGKAFGDMQVHKHPEEGMFVIDCAKAYVRFGSRKDALSERHLIEPGMIMWAAEDEWHIFEFDEDGFMDIVFCLPVGEIERPQ